MVLEVWDGKPTYRKSLARIFIGVVRFNLGPLLQGQTKIAKLKVLITRVLLVLEVWDGKPTYRKSWAGILLAWSDLT